MLIDCCSKCVNKGVNLTPALECEKRPLPGTPTAYITLIWFPLQSHNSSPWFDLNRSCFTTPVVFHTSFDNISLPLSFCTPLCPLTWHINRMIYSNGVSKTIPSGASLFLTFYSTILPTHSPVQFAAFTSDFFERTYGSWRKRPVDGQACPVRRAINLRITSSYPWTDLSHLELGALLLTWINLKLSMDKYYIHYSVWDEITYPFPNFNDGNG